MAPPARRGCVSISTIAAGVPAADLLKEAPTGQGEDFIDAERAALRRVLSRVKGHVSLAADTLGISRATLYRKMKKAQHQVRTSRGP